MTDLQAPNTRTGTRFPALETSDDSRPTSENNQVRVIIADPNEVFRMGVRSLVDDLGWAAVVGVTVDAPGLEQLLKTARADLVVLDLSIARTGVHGVHIIERIRELAPTVGVVVVTDAPNGHIRRAIELGAKACLTKTAGSEELAAALRLVANGRRYLQAELIAPLLNDASHDGRAPALSRQQLTILQLVSRGLRNKQIASESGLSMTTVKSHLRLIYSLLAVSSRAEAAAAAVRLGIVP